MKKKIKDLTLEEALSICHKEDNCCLCPLVFCGDDCIRKYRDKNYIPDFYKKYLESEVEVDD